MCSYLNSKLEPWLAFLNKITLTNSFSLSRLYTLPISSPSKQSSSFDVGYDKGNVKTITAFVIYMVRAPTSRP